MNLRPRVERDAYRALLVAILASLVLLGFGRSVGVLATAAQGITLLFALWTAAAHRRFQIAAVVFVAVSIVLSTLNDVAGNRIIETAVYTTGLLMGAAAISAILRRIRTHPQVSLVTVYAVLAIYLLVGLSFAYLFLTIGTATGQAFFAGHTDVVPADYIYFSFITITTVGFGDFVPATRLGEMLTASEAIIGQLYLVSVVSLVIGNFGRARNPGANG
jgi:Ion channel